jgi:N-acetylmuramoyl-L-alanine amidase
MVSVNSDNQGVSISTQTRSLSHRLNPQTKSARRSFRRSLKKSRKKLVRYSLFTANLALLVGVIAFVLNSPSTGNVGKESALAIATGESATDALDELSSADIAAHVAYLTDLDEARSVATNADSVNAQLSISPADDKVIAKTQVVATAASSYLDIKDYTAKEGDTITSIAEDFGITSNSIRWSNGLSGNTIAAGTKIVIPPINGVVYTVKSGDTADTLAVRYNSSKQAIIAFNDAEVSGLVVGRRIMIPDGVQPVTRTALVGSSGFAWGGYSAVYGGNGYDYGYCTWWAATRRAQIGRPVPSNLGNASTWKILAQRAGLGVGNTPRAGAVIWTPPRDYYGHVGFVESVNADGSVNISEMNTVGWGRVSRVTLTASQAAAYAYIY